MSNIKFEIIGEVEYCRVIGTENDIKGRLNFENLYPISTLSLL